MNKKAAFSMVLTLLIIALIVFGCSNDTAVKIDNGQSTQDIQNIALYKGSDRQDLIIKGAQEERQLMIYEAMNQEDMKPLLEKFMAKYPFINVQVYKGSADDVMQKLLDEYKAGRINADIFGSGTTNLEIARREQALQKFHSPEADVYPDMMKNKDQYWVTYRMQIPVLGYNTKLLSRDQVPKTYEDLLDPKWKRKISLDSQEQEWMATIIKYWGEQKALDYLQKLSQQDLIIRTGRDLHAQLLAAGEYPLDLSVLNHRIEQMKKQGAPVDYVTLEPSVARASAVSLPTNAKHINCALLWIDFILSEQGQKIFQSQMRIPANPKVPADPPRMNSGFKYIMRDDIAVIDEYEKWTSLFQNLFIRRQRQ